MHRRTAIRGALACAVAGLAGGGHAQPGSRPVRLVTGFLPGGSVDSTCRLLSDGLNRLGGAFSTIVDTRGGAAGRIAVSHIKSSPADGQQLLYTPGNVLSLLPNVYKGKVDYDPFKDLVPVHSVYTFGFVFSVGPGVPAEVKSLKDYLVWAKAHPDKASFGSPATGASPHLLGMQLAKTSGVPLTHIGYKGGGPLMTQDVLRGDVPAALQVVGDVTQHQGPQKIRSLATFGRQHSPFLPDVPTIAEAGFPELVNEDFGAIFAVKGTPPALIEKWAAAVRQVVGQAEFRTACATVGVVPNLNDAQETAYALREDHAFWAKVIASTGISLAD